MMSPPRLSRPRKFCCSESSGGEGRRPALPMDDVRRRLHLRLRLSLPVCIPHTFQQEQHQDIAGEAGRRRPGSRVGAGRYSGGAVAGEVEER